MLCCSYHITSLSPHLPLTPSAVPRASTEDIAVAGATATDATLVALDAALHAWRLALRAAIDDAKPVRRERERERWLGERREQGERERM
jgi:hypothetical protein